MKYMDIYSALKSDIADGVFTKTRRLPGESDLCRRFGVARNTVRQALSILQRQKLVETRKGEGTFVTRRGERNTGIIGLLIPDFTASQFFNSLKSELEAHARRLGYGIVVEKISAGTREEIAVDIPAAARRLAASRVEGVIFRPPIDPRCGESSREVIHIFKRNDTPVVLVDADVASPLERSDCDLVAVDNVGAGRRIADYLVRKGRRRIAFLALSRIVNLENRLFGLAGEVSLKGLDIGVSTLKLDPDDVGAVQALFRSRKRPDAIVCGNDEVAVRLIETIKSIGKRIPEDVAVVGFDDEQCARSSVPPLTTIRQPAQLIAKTALKTLLARIRHPDNDPREILLAAPLVVRQSS